MAWSASVATVMRTQAAVRNFYVIIGHSPRNLDRQLTMLGRVVQGMEIMSSFPRGTGDAGFYKTPKEYQHYADIKVASDLPPEQRTPLEIMKTDSESFCYVGELAALAEG